MRLQKFMAHSGVDSRRKCEEYICQGRVKVNDRIITELGTEVDPEKDKVYFDSKRIKLIIKNLFSSNIFLGLFSTRFNFKLFILFFINECKSKIALVAFIGCFYFPVLYSSTQSMPGIET